MRWLHGLQSTPDPHFYWTILKSMRGVRQGFDIRQIYEPLIVATGNGPYYCLVTTHELFFRGNLDRGWADFVPCLGRNLASLFRGHSQFGTTIVTLRIL